MGIDDEVGSNGCSSIDNKSTTAVPSNSRTTIVNNPGAEKAYATRRLKTLEYMNHKPGGVVVATTIETTLGTIGIFQSETHDTQIGIDVPVSRHDTEISRLIKLLKSDDHITKVSSEKSGNANTVIYTEGSLDKVTGLIRHHFSPRLP